GRGYDHDQQNRVAGRNVFSPNPNLDYGLAQDDKNCRDREYHKGAGPISQHKYLAQTVQLSRRFRLAGHRSKYLRQTYHYFGGVIDNAGAYIEVGDGSGREERSNHDLVSLELEPARDHDHERSAA